MAQGLLWPMVGAIGRLEKQIELQGRRYDERMGLGYQIHAIHCCKGGGGRNNQSAGN